MYKNIEKQTKLNLKELVKYQEGQVVSKTLVQNDYVSMTIFSFDKGEIISTIAIAVSSIVTTLIILLGVVLIIPLTPLLSSPVLEPAFTQILPALFGGLAVVFVSKNFRLALAPMLLMLVLFIFVPALNASTVGIMVPVGVLFSLGVARVLYKKGLL